MSPTGRNIATGQSYGMNPTQFGTQEQADRYLQMLAGQLGPGASVADAQFSEAGPYRLDQPYLHLRPQTAPYGGLNVGMLADLEQRYGTDPGSQFHQVVANDMAYMGRDDPSMRPDPVADPNNADVRAYQPGLARYLGGYSGGRPISEGYQELPMSSTIPLHSPPSGGAPLQSQQQQVANAASSGAERRRRLAAGLPPYADSPDYQIPTGPVGSTGGGGGIRNYDLRPGDPGYDEAMARFRQVGAAPAQQNAAPGSAVQSGIPGRNAPQYPASKPTGGGMGGVRTPYMGGGGLRYGQSRWTDPAYASGRSNLAGQMQRSLGPASSPRYGSSPYSYNARRY